MPCGQLYSVWHLLRPIAVITLETSRHAMFMPEPSARNTPHPLDTVNVAMIITSFEIKNFLFCYIVQVIKVVILQEFTVNEDFPILLGCLWIQICWAHESYKLYSTYNLKRVKCTKSHTQVGDSSYKCSQSKSNNSCHDIDTNKHKTTTWIISDCSQREIVTWRNVSTDRNSQTTAWIATWSYLDLLKSVCALWSTDLSSYAH